MNKLLVGLVVAALVVGVVGWFLPGTVVERVVERLGAVPGSDFLDGLYTSAFRDANGNELNTANATLTARQLCSEGYIELNYATNTQAVTLPSGASLITDCLNVVGNRRTLYLVNATSSGFGSQAIEVVAGASSTVWSPIIASTTAAGQSIGTSTLVQGGSVRLDLLRVASGSEPWIYVMVEPFLLNN